MSLTPSNMQKLGSKMAEFQLLDPRRSQWISSDEVLGEQGVLVVFMCNHCPYVKHILDEFESLHQYCQERSIGFVAVSSNDVETHPQDSPDKMTELAESKGWTFPYLYDESQEVARAYGAECTPDFFLYNGALELFYRGEFDSSRPGGEEPVTGDAIFGAVRCLGDGESPPEEQNPSIGCNIKWK